MWYLYRPSLLAVVSTLSLCLNFPSVWNTGSLWKHLVSFLFCWVIDAAMQSPLVVTSVEESPSATQGRKAKNSMPTSLIITLYLPSEVGVGLLFYISEILVRQTDYLRFRKIIQILSCNYNTISTRLCHHSMLADLMCKPL